MLQTMEAVFKYRRQVRQEVPALIYSEKDKGYIANATVGEALQFRTFKAAEMSQNMEENGMPENLNRSIMEGMRCVL